MTELTTTVNPEPIFTLLNVSLGYGPLPVVREVSTTIHTGEFLTLLGANGSGKSTLVKGLLRLARVTNGSIEVFGTQQRHFRHWQRIGYVPQRGATGGHAPASVWEVVSSGRLSRSRLWQPFSANDRQAVRQALETVGLAETASKPMASLSGGQARRVLLARALAGQPEVLVLDEPMAGVDLANQDILAEVLHRLHAHGTTIVLVAHELGPLAPHIQRVLTMREGRLHSDERVLEEARPEPDPPHDEAIHHCEPATPTNWLRW